MWSASLRTGLVLRLRRGSREHVEHATAVATGAAAGNASCQLRGVDLHQHDRIQRLADLPQHRIERRGLIDGARKTVEDEAAPRVGFRKALPDHAEHDVVFDQQASIHGLLCLQPERSSVGDGGAQQIAGGDLRNAVPLDQTLRLSALTGAGRAQQDDAHGGMRSGGI